MKTLEQMRIEAKLKLWETPGFFQFLDDLEQFMGHPVVKISNNIRNDYVKRLKELAPETKFKQGKLPL